MAQHHTKKKALRQKPDAAWHWRYLRTGPEKTIFF